LSVGSSSFAPIAIILKCKLPPMINEPKTIQAHFDFRTIHKIRNRNVTIRIMGYANPKKGKRNWVFG
jgi:hypothetical protein